MGRPCSVCQRSDIWEINGKLTHLSLDRLAATFSIPVSTIRRHKRHFLQDNERGKMPLVPEVPLPADPTPKEQAAYHCETVKLRLRAAEGSGASEKEIAALFGQYTNALRHHASLSGAHLTEPQVLKSVAWGRIMATVREVLVKHPKALLELDAALAALDDKGGM